MTTKPLSSESEPMTATDTSADVAHKHPHRETLAQEPEVGTKVEESSHAQPDQAQIPDLPWVKTADLHTGDEEGMPKHADDEIAYTEEHQPEGPVGQKQIDDLAYLEQRKDDVSAEAIKTSQGTDFQTGGKEDLYLSGGVKPVVP